MEPKHDENVLSSHEEKLKQHSALLYEHEKRINNYEKMIQHTNLLDNHQKRLEEYEKGINVDKKIQGNNDNTKP